MRNEQSVIGVDGGGTKTRAVWIRRDGSVLAMAQAGGSNYQEIGVHGVNALLEELVGPWLVNTVESKPACICLGLAGAGRPTEQRAIKDSVLAREWSDRVRVESDARAALAGAHAEKRGMIVIAGTGSIVFGIGENGDWVRAGGWGPLLGDEGSGYDIALRGIRAGLAAHDGSGPDTALSRSLLEELGIKEWAEIVSRVYGGDLDRPALASLAPSIMRCAEEGDRVAIAVIRSTAEGLAKQIAAVSRRSGIDKEDGLSYCGGLLTGAPLLRYFVEESLRSKGIDMRLMPVRLPAVLGAVVLAWEHTGSVLGESELAQLESVAASLLSEA